MTQLHPTLTWYLPSFYGDIRLERVSNGETRVVIVGLSSTEKAALRTLQAEATRSGLRKSPWANAAALERLDLDALTEQAVVIGAPLSKVQRALEKPMKPGRDCLSVVRYKNGAIEEVTEKVAGVLDVEPAPEAEPERETKPAPRSPAVSAVTVAAPTQGCPAPDFEAIDHRANRVLRAFLTDEQLRDFNTEQSFMQRGADTGHLYVITSRNAPQKLVHQSFRSLYDLTAGHALCVHDWTIPAAEEMLTLALFVATPGKEAYVRAIPDN